MAAFGELFTTVSLDPNVPTASETFLFGITQGYTGFNSNGLASGTIPDFTTGTITTTGATGTYLAEFNLSVSEDRILVARTDYWVFQLAIDGVPQPNVAFTSNLIGPNGNIVSGSASGLVVLGPGQTVSVVGRFVIQTGLAPFSTNLNAYAGDLNLTQIQ